MIRHAHHEREIERLTQDAQERGLEGLIVVGSTARGSARVDSDIDVYRIVTDDALAAAIDSGAVSWCEPREDAWAGGYIDIKLISRRALEQAVAAADDPFRASLVGARVVADARGGTEELIARIVNPPPERFTALERSFVDQFGLFAGYFLPQAWDRSDVLSRRYAASRAALAALRAVLARDRVLFRGLKYQREQAQATAGGGADFAAALEKLAESASPEAAARVARHVDPSWDTKTADVDNGMLGRFIVENELSWLTGTIPPDAR